MESMHFTVFAGKEPPKDFVNEAVKRYSKGISATAVVDGEVVTLDSYRSVTAEDVSGLHDALGKDKIVTFWMAANATDIPDEEKQPFSMMSDQENKQHIVCFLDGAFDSYKKKDSAFTGAHHASQDYVYEKVSYLINKLATPDSAMEDDIKATIVDMTGTEKTDIETKLFGGKRGVMTLIASLDGNSLHRFEKANDRKLIADWGWASDHCGTVKSSAEPTNKYARRGGPQTSAEKRAEPGAAVAADTNTSVSELTWIEPDVTIQGNIPTKEWYSKVFGKKIEKDVDVPSGLTMYSLLNKAAIQVPTERLSDLRTMGLAFKVVPNGDPKSTKDTATRNIPSGGTAVPLPAMGQPTKDKVSGLFATPKSLGATLLDGSSTKVSTIEKIKAVKDKYPDFFKQMEKTSPELAKCAEDCVFWPYDMFENIAFLDAKASAILNWTLACRCAIAEAAVQNMKPAITNYEKPTLVAPVAAQNKYARR